MGERRNQDPVASIGGGIAITGGTTLFGKGDEHNLRAGAVAPVPQAAVGDVNPLGGDMRVNTTSADTQEDASVAALEGGGYVVVWSSVNTSYTTIKGQRYDASGNPVGSEFQVSTGAAPDHPAGQAAVTAVAGGGFVVTWTDFMSLDTRILRSGSRRNATPPTARRSRD
jgi:hypothetical protein